MYNSTWESNCLTRFISGFHSGPFHYRKPSLSWIFHPSLPPYPNCALWSESMVPFVLTFLGVVTVLTSVPGNLEVVSKWSLPTPPPHTHTQADPFPYPILPHSASIIISRLFSCHLTAQYQADYASALRCFNHSLLPSFSITPHSTSFKQTTASSLITNAFT